MYLSTSNTKNKSKKFIISIDKYIKIVYYITVRQRGQAPLTKGSEVMKTASVTEYLLKAILELIEKCHSIEELRESLKRILSEE